MSPAESLAAIERLISVANEFPELAAKITGLVADVLNPVANVRSLAHAHAASNGHAGNAASNGHLNMPRFELNGSAARKPCKPRAGSEPMAVEPKEWYSVVEFGAATGRDFQTVARWCRLGRVRAEKVPNHGSGAKPWRISARELARYQASGLLDINPGRN